MRRYWQQLERAQQVRLGVMLGVALAALMYVVAWEPLVQARDQERAQVAYHQATLDYLQAVRPQLERLRQRQQPVKASGEVSLLRRADETARAAGLAGALSRIEPLSEGQVSVWLNGASFETVMSWLQALSLDHAIEAQSLSATRIDAPGQVDVRVVLVRSS